MTEKSNFTERTLEKIRSGDRSSESKKKRKLSKLVLLIDAILVIIIVFYFSNKDDNRKLYYSSKMNYNNINMRFSLSNDENTGNYIFTISLKSEEKTKLTFRKSVASIEIFKDKKHILKKSVGKNITEINIIPGEVRSFAGEIDYHTINDFLKNYLKIEKLNKKSLFDYSTNVITLNAKITLNMDKKLSSTIVFKHEVNNE